MTCVKSSQYELKRGRVLWLLQTMLQRNEHVKTVELSPTQTFVGDVQLLMLVKSAGVDCQKTALTIQTCVRYIIHVYYSIYFTAIAITNTTATDITAKGTCLHVFFCDQACTRKRQSQRPQSTWAGDQVVCEADYPVNAGDTSFEAFFQRSEGEITGMIEDHRQRFGCVYT